MGAWGTTLYANDVACDIRGEYVDKLRQGKSNAEATKELIEAYSDTIGDIEEEPLFWYALADTQWNYGRLQSDVKERALFFLSQAAEKERWKEAGQATLDAWMKTLITLREKLKSLQPPEKKVSKYRLYCCKWQLGDIFAYRFTDEYSAGLGYKGRYVVFRKVSESVWSPGHIVPVVQVYKCIFDTVPKLEELKDKELLEQGFLSTAILYKPDIEKQYYIKLLSTSERVIPKDRLTYLGNLPGDDLIPFREGNPWGIYTNVGWDGTGWNNLFEKYILEMYLSWV